MKKKALLFLFITPIGLHLFCLFFLHFNERFHTRDFEHGFKQSYSTSVQGLDYENLDSILLQDFSYLGHGKQMLAFVSADGRYVLKVFNPMRPLKKRWYLQSKYWKRYSSLQWIKLEWFQKNARLKKLFTRHKLAFELLRDETGLLFVYLEPSERVNHYVHVTDNRGNKQTLILANTPFVIQEKAVLVPQHLAGLASKKAVKKAIARLEKLFDKRIEEGITDRIQTMENNYGFVGDKPIQIDIGRIRFDPLIKEKPGAEKARILQNFHEWLGRKFPEYE